MHTCLRHISYISNTPKCNSRQSSHIYLSTVTRYSTEIQIQIQKTYQAPQLVGHPGVEQEGQVSEAAMAAACRHNMHSTTTSSTAAAIAVAAGRCSRCHWDSTRHGTGRCAIVVVDVVIAIVLPAGAEHGLLPGAVTPHLAGHVPVLNRHNTTEHEDKIE